MFGCSETGLVLFCAPVMRQWVLGAGRGLQLPLTGLTGCVCAAREKNYTQAGTDTLNVSGRTIRF